MDQTPTVLISTQSHWVGCHSIHLDNYTIVGLLTNLFLENKSNKRVYVIIHEDAIRATGIWTLNQAIVVANRLVIGPDGNYVDPQLNKSLYRFLKFLGYLS